MSALASGALEQAWLDQGVPVPIANGWLSPRAAFQEVIRSQAVLVDIRDRKQRAREGEVHPMLQPRIIGPLLLEWRLDPRSETQLPDASYDARVVVLGDEPAAASAATELRQLGIHRAIHVVGGFSAWREAGMPALRPPAAG